MQAGLPANQFRYWRCRSVGCCSLLARWRRLLVLALLYFGALVGASAQAQRVPLSPLWPLLADTTFSHLSLDQGLPHQVVTSAAEDGDGFLWFGTQDGLARWDGYRFRVFRSNPLDPNALPSNYVMVLHRDSRGDIWIGMNNGMLSRYQRQRDQLQTIPLRIRGAVESICGDGGDGVWIGAESGLWHLAADGRLLEHLQHNANERSSLPDNWVHHAMLSSDGWLWVATDKGVVRRAPGVPGQLGFAPVTLPAKRVPAVYKMYQDRNQRIWLGTATQGAFLFDPRSNQAIGLQLAGEAQFGKYYVDSFVETGRGQIWLGTYGNGIVELDLLHPEQGGRRIVHDQSINASLFDNTVWHLMRDHSGMIWVASNHGISSHDPGQTLVSSLFGAIGRNDRLSSGEVYAVSSMPDGRIWIGLGNQGLEILSPDSATITRVRSDALNSQSALPYAQINAIVPDQHGQVFIGTGRGLYRTSLAAKTFERIALPGRDALEPMSQLVLQGEILYGGARDGLWQIDTQHPERSRHLLLNLSDFTLRALARGPDGSIWVGTQNGLNRVVGKEVEQILPDPANPAALANGFVSSLLFDQQGRLWVGTFGGGLHLMLPRSGAPGAVDKPRFRRIGSAQGLPSDNVNAILQDAQGYIWLSTDDGLARIDPRDFSVTALKRADGVAIRTYWMGSAARTHSGELLFGGDGGLTMVKPENFSTWAYQPPVVLSEVRVMGRVVPANYVNAHPAQAPPLQIAPDANSFTAEFAVLDFSAAERNRYSWRLEGWDRDWTETDASRRMAAYANLPPGHYQLRLRGGNRNGEWSSKELVLPLQVLPYWYQQWWWRALCCLLAVLLLLLALQWRTRLLRQRQIDLEHIVEQRTRQLETQQELVLVTNLELHDSHEALNLAHADLALSHNQLQQNHQQLETALKNLRDTQVQLVQQAKIASLGTLTAGVAHEINNPANFAWVGTYNLGQQLQELQQYLLQLAGPEAPPDLLASLQQRFEQLQQSLGSISEGTGRIRELVKDLRTFSRLDEAHWKAVRIADSLQATVNLVRTQYADQVDIRLDLEANPELECWPAQLNQVFMHLIVNACQAIQSRSPEQQSAQPGQLSIRSRAEPGFLLLEFEDNGSGIPATCIEHIFDPFFTTRSVGEGMGMGLSISYGIVQKHGGTISVQSRVGHGSCFRIRLPLVLAKSAEIVPTKTATMADS